MLKAEDAMIRKVSVASPEDSVALARLRMEREGVGALPVVNKNELVGIITHRDIILVGESGLKVKDIMTKKLVTVQRETPLIRVMELMKEHGYQRIPVVEGKKLVGLITQGSVIDTMIKYLSTENKTEKPGINIKILKKDPPTERCNMLIEKVLLSVLPLSGKFDIKVKICSAKNEEIAPILIINGKKVLKEPSVDEISRLNIEKVLSLTGEK